jgi:membrane fusion protein, copper/silver efflux system
MKTKLMMTLALAAVLAAGSLWLAAPQRLKATETNAASRIILYYTCPMHPTVKADKAGDCPQCGMTLRPVFKTDRSTNAPAIATTNQPAATMPGCCSRGGCCR